MDARRKKSATVSVRPLENEAGELTTGNKEMTDTLHQMFEPVFTVSDIANIAMII